MDVLSINGCAWLVWFVYWLIAGRFVKATKSSEGTLDRMRHLLPLVIGFYLIFHGGHRGYLLGPLQASQSLRWTGMTLTIAGLLFSVWGRIHLGGNWSGFITLKEGHELVRSGPYRYVRHPVYTGLIVAAIGSALVAATGDALVGSAIIAVSIVFKLRREEVLLTTVFGDQYREFQREVPALVPFLI